jgi:hypothetical protein
MNKAFNETKELPVLNIPDLERLIVSKIRKSAKGEECSLRLEVCNGNNETTVLAHIGHNRGMGMKCSDHFAVYACNSCHDVIDGRVKTDYFYDLELEKLRALEETQGKLFSKGLLRL